MALVQQCPGTAEGSPEAVEGALDISPSHDIDNAHPHTFLLKPKFLTSAVVTKGHNPSIGKLEAGGMRDWGRSGLLRRDLASQIQVHLKVSFDKWPVALFLDSSDRWAHMSAPVMVDSVS